MQLNQLGNSYELIMMLDWMQNERGFNELYIMAIPPLFTHPRLGELARRVDRQRFLEMRPPAEIQRWISALNQAGQRSK